MKRVMNNKRAQGMSTNTIILLVLGLIILAVLSIGFMTGWNAFKGETQKSNVDTIVEECATACSMKQTHGYCVAERELRSTEEDLDVKGSCAVFANEPGLSYHGVRKCPSINCNRPCDKIKVDDVFGKVIESDSEEVFRYDVSTLADNLQDGQKCVVF